LWAYRSADADASLDPAHLPDAAAREHAAASFIWGINTIFLLDAGLSNLEAFAANAFFTGGMVLFEVPTGIVADTIGPARPLIWPER
jgi:hypothetical protein